MWKPTSGPRRRRGRANRARRPPRHRTAADPTRAQIDFDTEAHDELFLAHSIIIGARDRRAGDPRHAVLVDAPDRREAGAGDLRHPPLAAGVLRVSVRADQARTARADLVAYRRRLELGVEPPPAGVSVLVERQFDLECLGWHRKEGGASYGAYRCAPAEAQRICHGSAY